MVVLKFSLLLFFPHLFPSHSIYHIQLIYQACPVAPFLPFIVYILLKIKIGLNVHFIVWIAANLCLGQVKSCIFCDLRQMGYRRRCHCLYSTALSCFLSRSFMDLVQCCGHSSVQPHPYYCRLLRARAIYRQAISHTHIIWYFTCYMACYLSYNSAKTTQQLFI